MALAIDGSSPATVTSSTVTAITASFTPLPRSIVLAQCAIGNSTGSGFVTGAITDSISSTNWKMLRRFQTTAQGTVEWWAMEAGASPAARTVTLTGSGANGKGLILDVNVLTGSEPMSSLIGGSAQSATATVAVTVRESGSIVFSALWDNATTGTYTAASNNTLDQSFSDATNGERAATGRSTTSPATGSFTAGFVGTVSQAVTGAVEVKALVTGATPSPFGRGRDPLWQWTQQTGIDANGGSTVTGTLAVTTDASTLAAAGTRSIPDVTGTLGISTAASTLAAAGTYTPPAFTGTLGISTAASTLAAAGTFTSPAYTGTLAVTTDASTLAASGTRSVPAFTGTLGISTAASTLAAAGTFTGSGISGTLNISTDASTLAASGSRTIPTVTGTLSISTTSSTLAAAGTFTASGVSGTFTATTDASTLAASGTRTVPAFTGTLNVTTTSATLAASGTFSSGDGGAGGSSTGIAFSLVDTDLIITVATDLERIIVATGLAPNQRATAVASLAPSSTLQRSRTATEME